MSFAGNTCHVTTAKCSEMDPPRPCWDNSKLKEVIEQDDDDDDDEDEDEDEDVSTTSSMGSFVAELIHSQQASTLQPHT